MRIRHPGWSATRGEYEVLAVDAVCCGATALRVRGVSGLGEPFSATVVYWAGETVEIVEVEEFANDYP